MKTLSLDVSTIQQDVVYTEVINYFDHKVKIHIVSNAYKFQSHARAYVWSPVELKWNPVADLHSSLMKTPHAMYVRQFVAKAEFKADRDELVTRFTAILD